MKCVERFKEYEDDDFDRIILLIRNGTIKAGRYSHLVKVDEKKMLKGKTFFRNKEPDDVKENVKGGSHHDQASESQRKQ